MGSYEWYRVMTFVKLDAFAVRYSDNEAADRTGGAKEIILFNRRTSTDSSLKEKIETKKGNKGTGL